MRRRGSTIAEMIFTLALCVTVMGASTLLYGHATTQTLDSVALLETSDGGDRLADQLEFLISNAIDAEVQTIGGRPVLKLTMPAVRGPRNANGLYDSYSPSYMHPRLGGVYLPGERIWIYCGTNTAAVSTTNTSAGTIPLLARRADDAIPGLADVDWLWTYRDGDGKTTRRSPSAVEFQFSVTSTLVTWSIFSRSSSGTNAKAIDTTRASTFRDLTIQGSTLLRLPAPQ